MSKEWDKTFIEELGQIFSAAGIAAVTDNIDGTDALMIEPDGEQFKVGCVITVEHLTEDCTGVYMMFPMFFGLERGVSDDLRRLLRYMNKFLKIGSFVVSEDEGTLYYRHTFVIDEAEGKAVLFGLTADTLDIAAATAAMGADIAAPVIEGRTPVSQLLNNDTAIIQQ